MIPILEWYEWVGVALTWALIPAVLLMKRRQDREHAQADRNLEIELQAIRLKQTCGVCHAFFAPGVKGNICGLCGKTVCMWCCDGLDGGVDLEAVVPGKTILKPRTFICKTCTEGPRAA